MWKSEICQYYPPSQGRTKNRRWESNGIYVWKKAKLLIFVSFIKLFTAIICGYTALFNKPWSSILYQVFYLFLYDSWVTSSSNSEISTSSEKASLSKSTFFSKTCNFLKCSLSEISATLRGWCETPFFSPWRCPFFVYQADIYQPYLRISHGQVFELGTTSTSLSSTSTNSFPNPRAPSSTLSNMVIIGRKNTSRKNRKLFSWSTCPPSLSILSHLSSPTFLPLAAPSSWTSSPPHS